MLTVSSQTVSVFAHLCNKIKNKKAVLLQGNLAMLQVFFSVYYFVDIIHYKFKSSQASKAKPGFRALNIP